MSSTCDHARDELARREAGLLDPAADPALRAHLDGCEGCRAYSGRMKTLVGLLEDFPEVREIPRRPRLLRWAPLAAAILVAVAVPLLSVFFGPQVVVEGNVDQPSRGVWVARDASASLVVHEHRLRLRKGTRVRLAGPSELFLEEGRLDVSGLQEASTGLKIGTPLGRITVLGTRFVVEVNPMPKTPVLAAGGFIVGVLVSSGVVSYGDQRLEAGQGVVEETGKPPRRVAATDLQRRLRASLDRERELEARLAALGLEREQLRRDVAALERGEVPKPRVPLTAEQRRAGTHRLAQVLVKSLQWIGETEARVSTALDDEEVKRILAEKGSLTVEQREVVTSENVDGKALGEALTIANELGVDFFDVPGFIARPDLVEELMIAVLESKGTPPRPAVEAAVGAAYSSLPASWESKADERVDQARALGRALAQLEGTLPAAQATMLYKMSLAMVSVPSYSNLAHADAAWRGAWVDDLAKHLELDEAGRAVLNPLVDDFARRLAEISRRSDGEPQANYEYMIQCRDRGADFVRQLTARFPDQKDRTGRALEGR